jgi:hypothetical protein
MGQVQRSTGDPMSEKSEVVLPVPLIRKSAIVGTVAIALATGFALGPAAPARECVGMFAGGDRRTVAADTKGLVVVGQEKPPEDLMGWSQQGIYRVFDDGAVEFLATPVPPRPAGDTYVWIRYPNPG